MTALQGLDPVVRERLALDMRALFEQTHPASNGPVVAPGEYLEVGAVRRSRRTRFEESQSGFLMF